MAYNANMNTEKTKLFINTILVSVVSFVWASVYWLGNSNLWQVNLMLSTSLNRPWVYRQLVPSFARLISASGVRPDISIVLIVTFAGVGFYFSLRRLVFLLYKKSDLMEVLVIASVFFGMFLFGRERLPYDLMTVFLFTLSLLLLAQDKFLAYCLLFPIVCLNRETGFLLIVFTVFYDHDVRIGRDSLVVLYQVLVWFAVRLGLLYAFRNNGGVDAFVMPVHNLQVFLAHPLYTLIHALVFGAILLLVVRHWWRKPLFLRKAFIIFMPILLVAYWVFGQPYELRVFWEVYPVTALLLIAPERGALCDGGEPQI